MPNNTVTFIPDSHSNPLASVEFVLSMEPQNDDDPIVTLQLKYIYKEEESPDEKPGDASFSHTAKWSKLKDILQKAKTFGDPLSLSYEEIIDELGTQAVGQNPGYIPFFMYDETYCNFLGMLKQSAEEPTEA